MHPFEQNLLSHDLILEDGSLNSDTILDLIHSPKTVWNSLVINRRKPHTIRVFTFVDNIRVCLHKFYPCNSDEAFAHPHPWPAKFFIMGGSGYLMDLGRSDGRIFEPEESTYERLCMKVGSSYSILNPLTWHRISPIKRILDDVTGSIEPEEYESPTYTIMLNGEPFSPDVVHTKVRTTAGKDLEKLSRSDVSEILGTFMKWL